MSEQEKNKGGRPTKLDEALVVLAERYLTEWKEDEEIVVPTIEGLCSSLGIAKKTLFRWEVEAPNSVEDKGLHDRFCHCIDSVRQKQAEKLIHNGLGGKFNSAITKLLLSNLGYREKSDVTTDDKPIEQPSITITSDAVKEGVKAFEEAMRPKKKL